MVIDGKAVAKRVREEVKARVTRLVARGITPGLATVLVGDDPASAIYVRNKEKSCVEAGMKSVGLKLPAATSMAELFAVLDRAPPRIAGAVTVRDRAAGGWQHLVTAISAETVCFGASAMVTLLSPFVLSTMFSARLSWYASVSAVETR